MTSRSTTDQSLINDIIRREDDPNHPGVITNDPADSGGRTQYGISEHAHPEAWADGHVDIPEAEGIYEHEYLKPFKGITDEKLLHQLVDFGVPSGPAAAIKVLQHVLNQVPDGQLGPKTLAALHNYPAGTIFGIPVPGSVRLNFAFRDARVLFYSAVAKANAKNLKFLVGWQRRAQEFQ